MERRGTGLNWRSQARSAADVSAEHLPATHRRAWYSGFSESWQGRASSIFFWAMGRARGKFHGQWGLSDVGARGAGSCARQTDVPLPQGLKFRANELLEASSNARAGRVPAPGAGVRWTWHGARVPRGVGAGQAEPAARGQRRRNGKGVRRLARGGSRSGDFGASWRAVRCGVALEFVTKRGIRSFVGSGVG